MKFADQKLALAVTKAAAAVGFAALIGLTGQVASAAPAQHPLLLRSIQVIPNIMYTIDDSPSMTSIYMEEDKDLRLHPAEMANNVRGIVATTHELFVAQLRSSAFNTQYYDPAVRYLPWATSTGGRLPNADPAAVWMRPHPTSPVGPSMDLTVRGQPVSVRWCDTSWNSSDCAVRALPYTPAIYYRHLGGRLDLLENYQRVEILAETSFPKSPSRTDCAASTCTQQEELQNFANWFQYYRNRLLTGIGGTAEAFSRLGPTARIGYGALNSLASSTQPYLIDGGGQPQLTIRRGIRDFTGPDREEFFNWIYSINTRGKTPTKRAVTEVGEYFRRTDNKGPWGARPGFDDPSAHLSCRRNFHVVVTDGVWNDSHLAPSWTNADFESQTGPTITSDTGLSYTYTPSRPYMSTRTWQDDDGLIYHGLSDIALYFWSRDLRPDLPNNIEPTATNPAFWQHLVHYTVGLGIKGVLNPNTDLPDLISGRKSWSASRVDDIWHAALNSRGEYLSAQRPEEFAEKLSQLMETLSTEASLAGVTTSGRQLRAGTRKYVPEFRTEYWIGDLYAFELDENGVSSEAPVWAGSANLPPHDQRNIVFWSNAERRAKPFVWSQLNGSQQADLVSEAHVQYLRGDRSLEGNGFRRRAKLLGDIINSAPLYVKDTLDQEYDFLPAATPGRTAYRRFLGAMRNRTGLVVVGANDGMLHVFRDSAGTQPGDGVESFAFIPGQVLPRIRNLAAPLYSHQYYVDGPLSEHHAFLRGAWRSVVVGTTGAGGRSVFALDLTEPDNLSAASVLWEVNAQADPDLGYVFASPTVGLLGGRWVAIFGNGAGGASDRAQLWVVDLETGNLLRKIDTGIGSASQPNGLSGVRLILNASKQITGAYAGDWLGNVWKFDLSGSQASQWSVANGGLPLFRALAPDGTPQVFTVAPEYMLHPSGGNLVLVATGRLSEPDDAANTSVQSMYGVWDKPPVATPQVPSTLTRSNLVEQQHTGTHSVTTPAGVFQFFTTSQNSVDWQQKSGWYLDFTLEPGQRVIYPLSWVFGRIRIETIYARGAHEQCSTRLSGGINYLLDPLTGAMPNEPLNDVNGDGVVDSADALMSGYKTAADGSDAIVFRSPTSGRIISTGRTPRTISAGQLPVRRTWRQLQMNIR